MLSFDLFLKKDTEEKTAWLPIKFEFSSFNES